MTSMHIKNNNDLLPQQHQQQQQLLSASSSASRRCLALKKRRTCSFNPGWEQQFAFVKRSRKGNGFFYCAYCDKDINVQTMGISAIKAHIDNNKHRQLENYKQHKMAAGVGVTTTNEDQWFSDNKTVEQRQTPKVEDEPPQQQQRHYAAPSSTYDMQMATTIEATGNGAQLSEEGEISDFNEDESDNELFIVNVEGKREAVPWNGGKYAKHFEQIGSEDGTLVAKVRCLTCGKELSTKSRKKHNKLHQFGESNGFEGKHNKLHQFGESNGFEGMFFSPSQHFDETNVAAAVAASEAIATALVEEKRPIVMPLAPPTEQLLLTSSPRLARIRRDESVDNLDGDGGDRQHDLSQFDQKRQRIELQILEAELIQKQLSNYQRCTELGLSARVHLPIATTHTPVSSRSPSHQTSVAGVGRCFTTFSNAKAIQFDAAAIGRRVQRLRNSMQMVMDTEVVVHDNNNNADAVGRGGDDSNHHHLESANGDGTSFEESANVGDGTPCDLVAFADI